MRTTVLFWLVCFSASSAQTRDTVILSKKDFSSQINYFSPKNILDFAEYLQNNGDYREAVAEYQRLLFVNNEEYAKDAIWIKMIDCYTHDSLNHSALCLLDSLIIHSDKTENKHRFQFQKALQYFRLSMYDSSLNCLEKSNGAESGLNRLLEVANLYELRNWNQAKTSTLSFVPISETDSAAACQMESWLELRKKQPLKNTAVAIGLSAIIPGAGKIYTGENRDALMSLAIIAFSVYQAYDGFTRSGISSTKGWIFSTLGFGFYAGTIYGSAVSVKVYNERLEKQLNEKIEFTIHAQL